MSVSISKLLEQPVPNQEAPLDRKRGYREYRLNLTDDRNEERLVDVATYGIAGQSYYARPNAATGDAVPRVNPTVFVREGVAKKLGAINNALRDSEEVATLLGGRVELFVEEGLRSQDTQYMLYQDVFPRLIRSQFPGLSEQEVLKRRDGLIAKPSQTEDSPSPHATGGAVDVSLRYIQDTRSYVPDVNVFMGSGDASMGDIVRPDFFEHAESPDTEYELAQRNRRLFYWVMTGKLNGEDSGLVVNPTEWWHWSSGDQMWAALTGAPFAYYGAASGA